MNGGLKRIGIFELHLAQGVVEQGFFISLHWPFRSKTTSGGGEVWISFLLFCPLILLDTEVPCGLVRL